MALWEARKTIGDGAASVAVDGPGLEGSYKVEAWELPRKEAHERLFLEPTCSKGPKCIRDANTMV